METLLLKELIVAWLVLKFPAFHGNQMVYEHVHKSLSLDHILSKMNTF
jgi:hypothetical protein